MGAFDGLGNPWAAVVTTFKRDGTGVPTAVSVTVDGDHAYIRTWSTSGKAKRLKRDPHLLIAPSTVRGKPTGPQIGATARLLDGDEELAVCKALSKKHPVVHRVLVPLAHRVAQYETVHYELSAATDRADAANPTSE